MICKEVIGLFVLLYVIALLLLAVGTWGLFGAERDPLSAVFLVPLGLPWNLLLDRFVVSGSALVGILASAINLVILALLWQWLR